MLFTHAWRRAVVTAASLCRPAAAAQLGACRVASDAHLRYSIAGEGLCGLRGARGRSSGRDRGQEQGAQGPHTAFLAPPESDLRVRESDR